MLDHVRTLLIRIPKVDVDIVSLVPPYAVVLAFTACWRPNPYFVRLGPGSSSQCSITFVLASSYASTLDPTSALVVAAKSRPQPPPAGEVARRPPEGPAGGALPEAHFHAFWLHHQS